MMVAQCKPNCIQSSQPNSKKMGKPGACKIVPNNHQSMESEPVVFDKKYAAQEAFILVSYSLWLGFVITNIFGEKNVFLFQRAHIILTMLAPSN